MDGAHRGGLAAEVHTLNAPGSHMGTGSNPSSSTSQPAPCLWSEKVVKNGPKLWDPAPMWETRKRFLAPGFGSAQHRPLQSLILLQRQIYREEERQRRFFRPMIHYSSDLNRRCCANPKPGARNFLQVSHVGAGS